MDYTDLFQVARKLLLTLREVNQLSLIVNELRLAKNFLSGQAMNFFYFSGLYIIFRGYQGTISFFLFNIIILFLKSEISSLSEIEN